MIRNLLATTALATLVSTGVYAQDTTAPADPAAPATTTQTAPAQPVVQADGFLASDIIGETVYNGTGEEAEKIGDVNDIVIASDGNIESVIVGVGGFLGIGEKDVAVNFDEVEWTDRDGDRWMVVATTKEQLEEQPAFDRTPYEPAQAPVASTDTGMPADQSTAQAPQPAAPADTTDTAEAPAASGEATTTETAEAPAAPADSGQAATETAEAPAATDNSAGQTTTETVQVPIAPADSAQSSTDTAKAPADSDAAATDTTTTAAIDRSTLTEMPMDGVRAEDLIGTTVYGANDETIGEIGDVVLTSDGKIDAYIIDVGGFLGIGEKEVAIGSDNLAFMTDNDGNKYLYTNFSKEQLEATPDYDEASWAEKRDEQRLVVTQ